MSDTVAKVKCRLCEEYYLMVCRRCPGCTTPNPHFTGEPAVLLEGIEIEPEVYRALQVICGTDSKTLPEVAVNAIEFYITTRTRRKT